MVILSLLMTQQYMRKESLEVDIYRNQQVWAPSNYFWIIDKDNGAIRFCIPLPNRRLAALPLLGTHMTKIKKALNENR